MASSSGLAGLAAADWTAAEWAGEDEAETAAEWAGEDEAETAAAATLDSLSWRRATLSDCTAERAETGIIVVEE
jgi:hypothetical protein